MPVALKSEAISSKASTFTLSIFRAHLFSETSLRQLAGMYKFEWLRKTNNKWDLNINFCSQQFGALKPKGKVNFLCHETPKSTPIPFQEERARDGSSGVREWGDWNKWNKWNKWEFVAHCKGTV